MYKKANLTIVTLAMRNEKVDQRSEELRRLCQEDEAAVRCFYDRRESLAITSLMLFSRNIHKKQKPHADAMSASPRQPVQPGAMHRQFLRRQCEKQMRTAVAACLNQSP